MKLKPCPFCGSTKIKMINGPGKYWLVCDKCKASTNMTATEEKAIETWNRRSGDKECITK